MRSAAARLADMRPAGVRPAKMRRPEMRPAAACPEAYSAVMPTKPATMSAKTPDVSATTMPTATMSPAATVPAATAGIRFEGEKRNDDEQHRGNASAGSHGAAGLAPHRRGRLSLGILPRTKSFQYRQRSFPSVAPSDRPIPPKLRLLLSGSNSQRTSRRLCRFVRSWG